MLRSYTRERGHLIGAAIALLFLGPLVILAAIGTALGYLRLPEPWPAQLLGFILVLLWFIWLIFPILFSSLNEAADMTRLLVYPLRQRDLIAAVLLGTLFDYPTYLMLPMLLGRFNWLGSQFGAARRPHRHPNLLCPYGIHWLISRHSPGWYFAKPPLPRCGHHFHRLIRLILLFHCRLGLGRLIENVTQTMNPEDLLALRPLRILQWFPTGAAAQAIVQAADGQWLTSLAWLAYSSAWLLLIVWAWWKLLSRLTTGEGFLFSRAPRPQTKSRTRHRPKQPALPFWLRRLPVDLAHIMHKEFKPSGARLSGAWV